MVSPPFESPIRWYMASMLEKYLIPTGQPQHNIEFELFCLIRCREASNVQNHKGKTEKNNILPGKAKSFISCWNFLTFYSLNSAPLCSWSDSLPCKACLCFSTESPPSWAQRFPGTEQNAVKGATGNGPICSEGNRQDTAGKHKRCSAQWHAGEIDSGCHQPPVWWQPRLFKMILLFILTI